MLILHRIFNRVPKSPLHSHLKELSEDPSIIEDPLNVMHSHKNAQKKLSEAKLDLEWAENPGLSFAV